MKTEERITKYLDDELTTEEKIAFEKEMESSKELKFQISIIQTFYQGNRVLYRPPIMTLLLPDTKEGTLLRIEPSLKFFSRKIGITLFFFKRTNSIF